MGYFDYPGTSNYDSDLTFMIKLFKELIAKYEDLIDIYEEILERIDTIVADTLEKWLEDGTIKDLINEVIFNELNAKVDKALADIEVLNKEMLNKLGYFNTTIEMVNSVDILVVGRCYKTLAFSELGDKGGQEWLVSDAESDKYFTFIYNGLYFIMLGVPNSSSVGMLTFGDYVNELLDEVLKKNYNSFEFIEGDYYPKKSIKIKDNFSYFGTGVVNLYFNDIVGFDTENLDLQEFVCESLEKGERVIKISGGMEFEKGDKLQVTSSNNFNEYAGEFIREYYVKGQLFTVSYSKVFNGSIEVDEPSLFNLTTGTKFRVIKRCRNVKIKNVNVINLVNGVTKIKGVNLTGCENALVENVNVSYFANACISLNGCSNSSVKRCSVINDAKNVATGLLYGVVVNDGSYGIKISDIKASGCRHGISFGGTGWGIPNNNWCDAITVTDGVGTNASLDCHGNTLNISYSNCNVVNGVGISGIGHNLNNINSITGGFACDEGSQDCTFNNINIGNLTRLRFNYGTNNAIISNSNFSFGFACNFYNNPIYEFNYNTFMKCTFKNNQVVNQSNIDKYFSNNFSFCLTLNGDYNKVSDCIFNGVPTAVLCNGAENNVTGCDFTNCNFKPTGSTSIYGTVSITDSSNEAYLSNLNFYNNNGIKGDFSLYSQSLGTDRRVFKDIYSYEPLTTTLAIFGRARHYIDNVQTVCSTVRPLNVYATFMNSNAMSIPKKPTYPGAYGDFVMANPFTTVLGWKHNGSEWIEV